MRLLHIKMGLLIVLTCLTLMVGAAISSPSALANRHVQTSAALAQVAAPSFQGHINFVYGNRLVIDANGNGAVTITGRNFYPNSFVYVQVSGLFPFGSPTIVPSIIFTSANGLLPATDITIGNLPKFLNRLSINVVDGHTLLPSNTLTAQAR